MAGTTPATLELSAGERLIEVLTAIPEVRSIHWAVNDTPAEVTNLPTELLWGEDAIEEEIGGLRFRVRPNAFLQTNTRMAARLYEIVRDVAGLTGTKQGCDGGECGACTVLVDDKPRLACSTLAHQVAGRRVETIEGLARNGRMSRLQQAFHETLGAQCGFCTSGQLMSATALLQHTPHPTPEEARVAMTGNLCRCATYLRIREAIHRAAGMSPARPQTETARAQAAAGPK